MLSIRKIGAFGRTYRHLSRYRQILAILFKYGFGDIVERLNIDQYIEIGLQMISSRRPAHTVQKQTRPERVRMALEELGPTCIKLGQLLSMRADLIPVRFIRELSKLQDDVPPFPFSEVRQIFESEFGALPSELFEHFEEKPFASASIGQVHRARLRSGELVAVKVQRPGLKGIIEVDLEIMLHLAMLMEGNIEEFALHRPVKIVEEFARVVEKELDYTHEMANMERFAGQFFGDPTVYVPRVFRALTTDRILTMEFISGIKISRTDELERAGYDKKKIVAIGTDLLLRQVFDHGFFHADPHPGNIRVISRNAICMLDFGMMGTIDRYNRSDFVDLIYSVVRRDDPRTAQVLLKLTLWEREPDIRALERDVSEFMGQYLYKPLKEIEIGKLLQHLLELTSRHHLRLPPEIFLMLKALGTIEGIARLLDPDFDMVARAAPFIRREKMERFRPKRMAEDVFNLSSDLFEFVQQFPRELLELARIIKRQQLSVQFEHHGLEGLIETHDRISNKLSIAIIVAALIIGSSIVIIARIPPLFYDISLIGIIVFVAAVIMGIWLMIEIIRKGRI
ncbi:ABC transporter [Desulfonema ishimotonii]|uniref:ABC transporter n=1 Tax=Desulfonema ishimotonii TaxID=45657 RepID=A0A401G0V9_9BACT|nr:AarF/ABC1/UbiB kinase family protein [Desulfonema ishimotonii]GBC62837.1 ABC transporter [Desulfonema ishimotonii]